MGTRICGKCKCYEPEREPDGYRTGAGYCLSLATKRIGGEFRSPVGMVSLAAPACSHFIPTEASERDSSRVGALLAPPPLPGGVMIERVIEIQAGKCLRQQDTMASSSASLPVALDQDQRRYCEIQLAAALANPQFFGKISLTFVYEDAPSLVAWTVKLFPPGGEIRT